MLWQNVWLKLTDSSSDSLTEFFWAPKPKLVGLHPYKYTVVYQPVYNTVGEKPLERLDHAAMKLSTETTYMR